MANEEHTHAHLFVKAQTLLRAADRVLLVMHQNPDGDTLGSATALSLYLDDLRKPHDLFCTNASPSNYAFLPNSNRIQTNPSILVDGSHDVLVSLDSGDLVYAGIHNHLQERTKARHTIINIDHHKTNTHYGDLNIIDAHSSSTAEIVYNYFIHTEHPITTDSATCMLTGIISDTGGFSNLATTSSALNVASELLRFGARIWDIQQHTLKNKSIHALKLWGVVLSRLKRHTSGVVITVLTQNDIISCNASVEHAEGIANFLNTLDDSRAVFLLSELEPGKIKISMRSTQPGVDVSHFARVFGGGGNKKAAGLSIPGSIMVSGNSFHIA